MITVLQLRHGRGADAADDAKLPADPPVGLGRRPALPALTELQPP
jgi:hypothetical protein